MHVWSFPCEVLGSGVLVNSTGDHLLSPSREGPACPSFYLFLWRVSVCVGPEIFLIFFFIGFVICVCVRAHVGTRMPGSHMEVREQLFRVSSDLLHVGSRDPAQVLRLGGISVEDMTASWYIYSRYKIEDNRRHLEESRAETEVA